MRHVDRFLADLPTILLPTCCHDRREPSGVCAGGADLARADDDHCHGKGDQGPREGYGTPRLHLPPGDVHVHVHVHVRVHMHVHAVECSPVDALPP